MMEGICINLQEKAGLFRGNTTLSGVLPGASECKQSACNAMQDFNPCVRKIPPEKGMATHSSIVAWRIPWTEEPQRVRTGLSD